MSDAPAPATAAEGPRLTLSQLRVLNVVGRTSNLTRAAADLGTTQPAVSHSLRALERELGVRLFSRRSDGVTLTPVGQTIIHRVAVILAQLEGIAQEALSARGQVQGRLRIGVIPSVNTRLLPGLLRRFTETYDRVAVTVLEGSDTEVIEWLRTGAVDVATTTTTASDFHTIAFASDHMLAVVPISHRLAARHRIGIAELAKEPFIMSTGGCEPLINAIATRGGVRLRSDYRVRDTNSIFAMVAEGLGVTVMPELSLPTDATGICSITLHPAERRTIQLALPPGDTALPTASAFVDLATGGRGGLSAGPITMPQLASPQRTHQQRTP
jgi:DNA-binding transcriptional LysR family regulator